MIHSTASFIMNFILSPINWVVFLLIVSFIIKSEKRRKLFRWVALGIFIVFSNSWLLIAYARHWQPARRDISKDSTYSCAILLGGFGSPDENEQGYFNGTADRYIQAVRLYKLGKISHIIINGGNGRTQSNAFSEGVFVKNELKIMGVPDSAILFEDRSTNTADNAKNARKILDSTHLQPPYLLITSAHHMPRAALLFKNAGIPTTAFPCAYVAGNETYKPIGGLPKFEMLFKWEVYIKETFAYYLYKIMGS